MENEITEVSERVLDKISKNEYGQISVEISQESATQLITGLCEVALNVSEKAYDTVAQIYTEALVRQEHLEIKTMENEAEVMKRFNDQVDEAMKKLDFSKPETVAGFERVCSTLRDNLLAYFRNKHKPSLLDKLFRRH